MSSSEDQNTKQQEQFSGKPSKETVAYKFWQEFQEERKDIQKSIDDLSTKSKSLITKLCEEILVRINLLEKKTTDATIYLPSYDQRQSILQIRALVEELNVKKAEIAPKSKFSFKSRKPNVISGNGGGGATEAENKKESNITTTPSTTATESTSSIINENFQVITLNNKQNSYLAVNSYLSSPTNDSTKIMDFHLSSLQNCFINLVSKSITIGAIHIKGLKNCVILAGPVNSSILIYDCENCVFVVACHQFRMHTSKQMIIYLHATSHPIIEDCDKIKFAPYTLSISGLDEMFEAAKLDQKNNKYDTVEDFNWLRQQASPHWNLLEEKYLRKDWPLINIDDSELKNVLCEILEQSI
ncbi:tubulin binding cofactor C-domain-containing protein [Glomus cerebriforme]|uniref:Tubulin binding cofactor C-domain-containing protein n=1 Tax=Glomus cerebriforme TaxID=658196 RepID=A0A397TQD4_9GLOM|nr:tubulin binding cofactor C-domain-containing protein [Glomus cerebriforme]